jgi:hypothetical protein
MADPRRIHRFWRIPRIPRDPVGTGTIPIGRLPAPCLAALRALLALPGAFVTLTHREYARRL